MMDQKNIQIPKISFSKRRGRTLIYHTVIRLLDEPKYIRFLFNSKDKKIAIQACEAIDRDSFKVPEYGLTDKKIQFDISSVSFLNIIYKR